METPEEFHRLELKKIGYRDEPTEKIIKLYASNHTYTFAEKYHQEQLRICAVSCQREQLVCFGCGEDKTLIKGVCQDCYNDGLQDGKTN